MEIYKICVGKLAVITAVDCDINGDLRREYYKVEFPWKSEVGMQQIPGGYKLRSTFHFSDEC